MVEGREEGGGGRNLVLSDFPGEGKRDVMLIMMMMMRRRRRRRRRKIRGTCLSAGCC